MGSSRRQLCVVQVCGEKGGRGELSRFVGRKHFSPASFTDSGPTFGFFDDSQLKPPARVLPPLHSLMRRNLVELGPSFNLSTRRRDRPRSHCFDLFRFIGTSKQAREQLSVLRRTSCVKR